MAFVYPPDGHEPVSKHRSRPHARGAPSIYAAANGWQAPSENSHSRAASTMDRAPKAWKSSNTGARNNQAHRQKGAQLVYYKHDLTHTF